MRPPCGNGPTLTQIATTCLYQAGGGANMVFLRWNEQAPPLSLTLQDVWADAGPPANPGYLVFLNAIPQQAPQALEEALRGALPAPVDTGFVWAVYSPGATPALTVQTLLPIRPGAAEVPCVDGNVQLAMLPGARSVGFGDLSPVTAQYEAGCITGFAIAYPTLPGAQPPNGAGVNLPMIGDGVGCVRFAGLVNTPGRGRANQESAAKTSVLVSIDPLHPLDPTRNYQTFTGQDYTLTYDGSAYRLTPAP